MSIVRPNIPDIRDNLEKVRNTFVVKTEDGRYQYFPAMYSMVARGTNGKFVDFVKMPPIISDGFAYYKRKIYAVTRRELLRGYINVSKPQIILPKPVNLDTTEITNDGTILSSTMETTSSDKLQSGTLESVDSGINEAIDLAWQEQIDTLQYLEHC